MWYQDFSRFVHLKGLRGRSIKTYLGWVGQLARSLFRHRAVRYLKRSAISSKRIIGYDKAGKILIHWISSSSGKPGILTRTLQTTRLMRGPPRKTA